MTGRAVAPGPHTLQAMLRTYGALWGAGAAVWLAGLSTAAAGVLFDSPRAVVVGLAAQAAGLALTGWAVWRRLPRGRRRGRRR